VTGKTASKDADVRNAFNVVSLRKASTYAFKWNASIYVSASKDVAVKIAV
jgi:hypothetical protein